MANMCIIVSPRAPLQTLAPNLCTFKNNNSYKKKKQFKVKKKITTKPKNTEHTMWHSYSFIQTSMASQRELFNNQNNGTAHLPPPLSEGMLKENGNNEVNKEKPNSWETLHRHAPAQNTTVSFQQHSLCIGRIKHLWCSGIQPFL